jgi:hypothetical protein
MLNMHFAGDLQYRRLVIALAPSATAGWLSSSHIFSISSRTCHDTVSRMLATSGKHFWPSKSVSGTSFLRSKYQRLVVMADNLGVHVIVFQAVSPKTGEKAA